LKELKFTYFIDNKEKDALFTYLKDKMYKIYEINGDEVSTIQKFFNWAKNTLPQDPPLSGNINFDALVDSLWGGFDSLGEEKVAIVWYNSNSIINHDKVKFEILLECFEELGNSLMLEEYGIDKPIKLKVIFLGVGSMFSTLDCDMDL
jgi:Barstar (barnase inhibitor)